MNIKLHSVFCVFLFLYQTSFSQISDYEIDKKIDSILTKLTLQEKIAYLANAQGSTIPAFPPLNLPEMKVANAQNLANFQSHIPSPLGLAASWDSKLLNELGQHTAANAKSQGFSFLPVWGGNLYFNPLDNNNLYTFGEDPKLAANLLQSYNQGLQKQKTIGIIQNFPLQSSQTHLSERALQEIYFAPYQQLMAANIPFAIQLSNATLNHKPITQYDSLLKTALRNQLVFKGLLFATNADALLSPQSAFATGIDVIWGQNALYSATNLTTFVEKEEVLKKELDDKLRRFWRLALKTTTNATNYPATVRDSVFKYSNISSFVLLKNPNNLLPLDVTKTKKVAILELNGNSFEQFPANTETSFSYFSNQAKAEQTFLQPQFFADSQSSQMGVITAFYDNTQCKGSPLFIQTNDSIFLKPNIRFRQDSFSVKWIAFYEAKTAGNYTFQVKNQGQFRLLIDGKVIMDKWQTFPIQTHVVSFSLSKGQHSISIEHYGSSKNITELKFGMTQTPIEALLKEVEKFKHSDAVIIVVGDKNQTQRSFEIPHEEMLLITEIAKFHQNVIVVVNAAGSVNLEKLPTNVAIFYAFQPSAQYASSVLWDLLTAKVNPSGKLPISIERKITDNPIVNQSSSINSEEDIFMGYRFFDKKGSPTVAYPFGYGLSYSYFYYSNLKVTPNHYEGNGEITVSFDVNNVSKLPASEVAQIYLHDTQSKVIRPEKELKAFQKVYLKPGETQHITLTLTDKDLQFYNSDTHVWEKEKGLFEVSVGGSSKDANLTEVFSFGKRKKWF